MSRRLLVALAVVGLGIVPGVAKEAQAQDRDAIGRLDLAPGFADALAPGTTQVSSLQRPAPLLRRSTGSSSSAAVMWSLYASTAALQALDVHSTMSAFDNGAVEANPMMKGIAGNKAAFFAIKAGVAATTILTARSLAKRNKVAAIVTLIAINSAYAMIVNHNYEVARGGR